MRKLVTLCSLVAGLSLAATPAFANGVRSWRVCGGSSFMTCSAVEVSVTGQNVTVRVWNLSMNQAAAYGHQSPGSIIGAIGFYNLPQGVQIQPGTLQVSGPGGVSSQAAWQLKSFGPGTVVLDGRAGPGRLGTGIASGCDPIGQVGAALANPCAGVLATTSVTFNFRVSGQWDPRNAELSVLSFDSQNGTSSENWTGMGPNGQPGIATTITPEPVSMTLLATGLLGLGGAGLVRRKKLE